MKPDSKFAPSSVAETRAIAAIHATARDNWPWQHFKDSGAQTERQQQLMMALANSPDALTQREIFQAARKFGYPEMTNGSRISELVAAGALRVAGRRRCTITGQTVFTYALTGAQPNKPKPAPVKNALVLYAIIRDGVPIRVASHPLEPKENEAMAFFTADKRRSSKNADGMSILPDELQSFEYTVGAPEHRSRPRVKSLPKGVPAEAQLRLGV